MAKTLIVGTVGDSKKDLVDSTPVGTETLDASVAAGEIGIYLNTVPANSGQIDRLLNNLRDKLREIAYA